MHVYFSVEWKTDFENEYCVFVIELQLSLDIDRETL